MSSSQWRTINVVSLLGIALCISGQWAVAAEPALPMCLGAPGMTEEQAAEHIRTLEQGVLTLDRATARAYQALPFEELELAAAQKAVGVEPVALFNWVRDETRWLPYAGALRGAEGVLLDRSGSSLDRSLLLAALLEEAGHVARLVRTELDENSRELLEAAWQHVPIAQQVVQAAPAPQDYLQAAAVQALPVNDLQQVYQRQQQDFEQTRARLQDQTRRQVSALQAQQGGGPDAQATQQSATLMDHWWVQWQGPDGWRDLDPALPEQSFGERLITNGDVSLEFHYPEELPDEYHHWLTIEIVAEQWAHGQLHEHIALQQRLSTASLAGQQLRIDTPPLSLPDLQSLIDGGATRDSLHQTLLAESRWVPYLHYGDDVVRQKLINADGSVEDALDGTITSTVTRAISSATSALDALSLDGRPGSDTLASEVDAPVVPPQLTAVMVRLHVAAPGREVDVFERPLMDLLGSAARNADVSSLEISDAQREQRSAALMSSLELMPQTNWLPPEQLTAWRYLGILENRQGLLGAAYSLTYSDFSFAADILASNTARRSELDSLAALRLAFSPHLENIALTRLNLLGYVNLVDYRQGELVLRQGFDIIDNRVDVFGSDDPASVRMAQGVLDTLLEAELLALASDSVDSTAVNTARAYGQDLERAIDWQWIVDAAQLGDLGWAPDADMMAHYQRVLASGQVLIMPEALMGIEQASWWQFDPATGDMLGFGPDRRGQIIEAVVRLFSAMDNAGSAVQMVATIWGCMGQFASGVSNPAKPAVDPQCCIAKAAGEAMVGAVADMGILSTARGTWKVGISYSPVGSLGVLDAGLQFHSSKLGDQLGSLFFSKMECN